MENKKTELTSIDKKDLELLLAIQEWATEAMNILSLNLNEFSEKELQNVIEYQTVNKLLKIYEKYNKNVS